MKRRGNSSLRYVSLTQDVSFLGDTENQPSPFVAGIHSAGEDPYDPEIALQLRCPCGTTTTQSCHLDPPELGNGSLIT